MKADVICPMCKVKVASLQKAEIEEAVKLFKGHLPSHVLRKSVTST